MDGWVMNTRAARRMLWALVGSAALLLGVTASASAGTLDQQQTASNANGALWTGQSLAQTFTAGLSGRLDQVDVQLIKVGTPPDVTVEIRDVSAGSPGAAARATATVPGSAIGTTAAFVPVTFATPATVTAGTQYAIVVYSPAATAGPDDVAGAMYQTTGNPYSQGTIFVTHAALPPTTGWSGVASSDMAFKTYVTPPPPAPVTTNTPAATATKCKKKKKHKSDAVIAKKCKKKKHHH